MARMIPPVISGDDVPPGEKLVFRQIRQSTSAEDWVVLHSLDLAGHVSQVMGEMDFLVIIPGKGVLCAEVKSHRSISYTEGVWYLGGKSERDPFRQVRDNKHSLLKYLKRDDVPVRPYFPIWHTVIFPYVNFSQSSPEWNSWEIIDRRKINQQGVVGALGSVAKHVRRHLSKTTSWFDTNSASPSTAESNRLAEILRPEFELFESPASRAGREQKELLQYTRQQYDALDVMERNPRVIFEGNAGTGKTLLAVEAARRAALRDYRVLFVCYNRLLGAKLKKQFSEMDAHITCGTLHSLMMDVSGPFPDRNSPDEKFYQEELPFAAAEDFASSTQPFDFVVIDEAQDLLGENYILFLDACVDGGLRHGEWAMFGDFSNQSIYSGNLSPKRNRFIDLDSFRSQSGSFVFPLKKNCRNRPRIVSLLTSGVDLNPGYSETLLSDNKQDPIWRTSEEDSRSVALLEDELNSLLDKGYRPEEIVVLSPQRKDSLARRLASRPSWDRRLMPYEDSPESGFIRFTTIYAFKGLEARAVVITDFIDLSSNEYRGLFYVAASRAINTLVIISSPAAAQHLLSAA